MMVSSLASGWSLTPRSSSARRIMFPSLSTLKRGIEVNEQFRQCENNHGRKNGAHKAVSTGGATWSAIRSPRTSSDRPACVLGSRERLGTVCVRLCGAMNGSRRRRRRTERAQKHGGADCEADDGADTEFNGRAHGRLGRVFYREKNNNFNSDLWS